jgi:hypothetical protein
LHDAAAPHLPSPQRFDAGARRWFTLNPAV